MLPYRDSKITKLALVAFFIVLIGYGYFEARGFLYGPRIIVPSQITEVRERLVLVKGQTERIAELRMNDRPIAVTEDGHFEEPYLLAPGLNRIILDARDKYGRTRQEIIQIVYVQDEDAFVDPGPSSTSTRILTPVQE